MEGGRGPFGEKQVFQFNFEPQWFKEPVELVVTYCYSYLEID